MKIQKFKIFFLAAILLIMATPVRAEEEMPPTTTSTESFTIPGNDPATSSTTPSTTDETETASSTPDETIGEGVDDATSTPPIAVNLNLRYQNNLIFSGQVNIPTNTIFLDSNGEEHVICSANVLSALLAADEASDSFTVSQIQYYPEWNSYYLKCIQLNNPENTLCENWNYVVNSTYPSVGMDSYPINGEENIYVYFNNPWNITASTNTLPLGASTTLYTWRYNFDDLENDWISDGNDMVDISVPNPEPTGWWDTTLTVTTTVSDDNGITHYLFDATGTYYAKITSADYSKWSPAITINVIEPSTESTSTENNNNGGGNNGGGGTPSYQKININAAVNFLNAKHTNGDFGSMLLTDWAAVAFAADGTSAAKEQVKNYLIANTDAAGGMNSVSDNARRAIALMSLGVNPYSGTAVNYIKKITDAFDGTQFGDNSLYNDDIFALLVLLKAGYAASDPMLASDVNFILSKQDASGSFGSTDMTAAAVQALSLADGASGVANALTKAKSYLLANQGADGSFAGPTPAMTTAWSIQALTGAYNTDLANNYLYTRQATDGGIEAASVDNTTRIWATAYAIPATLGRTWGSIMQSFSVPADDPIPPSSPNSGNAPAADTATAVTTTAIITTTTLDFATPTSTPTTTTKIITTTLEIAAETDTPNEKILLTDRTKPKKSSAPSLDHTAPETMPTSSSPALSTASTTPPAITNDLVNTLPLDTPSRQAAKKLLAISGGGALTVGLYLGLKLLKIVV